MKQLYILLVILFVAALLSGPVIAADVSSPENATGRSSGAAPVHVQETTRAPVVGIPFPRDTSAEVEHPVTRRETPAPTTPVITATPTRPPVTATVQQTATATPTGTSTATVPATTAQQTAVQIVTVTVPVNVPVYYPSGSSYYPYHDYSYYSRYAYDTNGVLTVTSNPSEATVILDGYTYGTTPYIFTRLSPGYHTVEVDYPGYQAWVSNVYLDSGQTTQINADLTQLINYGSLFVDATPQGADVYVDGNYEGTSPLTVSGLAVGPHQLELHLAGYEVAVMTEQVTAGQGTVAYPTLQPLSATSGTGAIDITTNVPGALVYLDGIYRGSIQSGTVFSLMTVTPGSHELFLHLPGYNDDTRTITVNAGQITQVSVSFSPQPTAQPGSPQAAAGTGSLVVTSAPAGGQVTVDNVFRGVAPVTIYNVAAGSHVVNIRLGGYSDWSSSASVAENQIALVSATLVPSGGAAPVATRTPLAPFAAAAALALAVALAGLRFPKS